MTDLTKIAGLVSQAEASMLAALAANVPEETAIVEIGAYTGKSAVNLADASPGRRVYCVDLWDMLLPGEKIKKRRRKKYDQDFNSRDAFRVFRERTADYPNVTWIKGASAEVAKAWSRPIGLLFIDGAHDPKSVRADYQGWARHIVSGGWIAFHDAEAGGPVRRVIDEEIVGTGLWEGWALCERLAYARRL